MVFYQRFIALAIALFTCVWPTHASPWENKLQPHTNLGAKLTDHASSSSAFSSAYPTVSFPVVRSATPQPLFADAPLPDGGWQALATVLAAMAPSADTRLALSASQITQRIRLMVDQGRYGEALQVIEKRQTQRTAQGELGTDVQLLFLKARALSGLGQHNAAAALYLNMTTQYPELPEPWNNLAIEYVRQNRLAMAADALRMALTAYPNYTAALNNLGHVQLLRARETLSQAAQAGSVGAAQELQQLDEHLR